MKISSSGHGYSQTCIWHLLLLATCCSTCTCIASACSHYNQPAAALPPATAARRSYIQQPSLLLLLLLLLLLYAQLQLRYWLLSEPGMSFASHSRSAAAQISVSVGLKLNSSLISAAKLSAVSTSGSNTKSMVRTTGRLLLSALLSLTCRQSGRGIT
jgi:hypothetical protein